MTRAPCRCPSCQQAAEVAVTENNADWSAAVSQLHHVGNKLDVHIAFHFPASGVIGEFLGGLGDHRVAVVIQPVDQRADRRVFLVFHQRGVIEGAHEAALGRDPVEQPLVVDVEVEAFGCGVEVSAVDEYGQFFLGSRKKLNSMMNCCCFSVPITPALTGLLLFLFPALRTFIFTQMSALAVTGEYPEVGERHTLVAMPNRLTLSTCFIKNPR